MNCELCGDNSGIRGTITFRSGKRVTPELRIACCELCYDDNFMTLAKMRRAVLEALAAAMEKANDTSNSGGTAALAAPDGTEPSLGTIVPSVPEGTIEAHA